MEPVKKAKSKLAYRCRIGNAKGIPGSLKRRGVIPTVLDVPRNFSKCNMQLVHKLVK